MITPILFRPLPFSLFSSRSSQLSMFSHSLSPFYDTQSNMSFFSSSSGNVGLSLGYPTVSTSLSGQFSTFSKLVICAMMIRGRHRCLPYQLDRAIVLPKERQDAEGDEAETRDKIRKYPNLSRLKATYTT